MGATIPFEQVTETVFDEFMNVHFKGVYFLTQKFIPYLNNGGSIINISSGTTRFANPGYSAYATMKGYSSIHKIPGKGAGGQRHHVKRGSSRPYRNRL